MAASAEQPLYAQLCVPVADLATFLDVRGGEEIYRQLVDIQVKSGRCGCAGDVFPFGSGHRLMCIYHRNPGRCFCAACTWHVVNAGECPNGARRSRRDPGPCRHVWTPNEAHGSLAYDEASAPEDSWLCHLCGKWARRPEKGDSRIELVPERRPVSFMEPTDAVHPQRRLNKKRR